LNTDNLFTGPTAKALGQTINYADHRTMRAAVECAVSSTASIDYLPAFKGPPVQ